jgi:hypothetical protein
LILGGAAVHRCDNRFVLNAAFAPEGRLFQTDSLPEVRAQKSGANNLTSQTTTVPHG